MSEISELTKRLQENTNKQVQDSEQIVTNALKQLENSTKAQLKNAESILQTAINQHHKRLAKILDQNHQELKKTLDDYAKSSGEQADRLATISFQLMLAIFMSALLSILGFWVLIRFGIIHI